MAKAIKMNTLATEGQAESRDRGSRFLAFARRAQSRHDVDAVLAELRQAYADAHHHCYAFRFPEAAFASDDGEPAHSAGSPILRRLQHHNLINAMVVVIRYFGGVKLGVPGLINAYGTAAEAALSDAMIRPYIPTARFRIRFAYEQTAFVQKALHAAQASELNAEYAADCTLWVEIPLSSSDYLHQSLAPFVLSLESID